MHECKLLKNRYILYKHDIHVENCIFNRNINRLYCFLLNSVQNMSSSDSDSDSSTQAEQPKQTTNKTMKKFKCNRCDKEFKSKFFRTQHYRFCKKQQKSFKCSWCNLEFTNRGNLTSHSIHIHRDYSYKTVQPGPNGVLPSVKSSCDACEEAFTHPYQLRYHIRKMHFNLQAKIPNAEMKKVNQIWFERVLNTNNIMEIKKTGNNTLVMKKLDKNTGIKINDGTSKYIDLSHLYPTKGSSCVQIVCELCKKYYVKKDYKKHYQEVHMNLKKHHCNNCNRSFKRAYQYLQHHCNKAKKIKGVRQADHSFFISSVESLSVPLGP